MKNRRISILTVLNKNIGDLSPAAEMELLRRAVRFVEQQLGEVFQADEGNRHHDSLRDAEAIAQLAKADWTEMWEANKRMPGLICPRELESLHFIAELAELRLAKARVAHVQSAMKRVESQLKELGEEVHRLRERVEVLSRRN